MTTPTFRDPQEAFEDAIEKGYLTDNDASDGNYAGHWMYMHTSSEGDHFKNRFTRRYLTVPSFDLIRRNA